MNSIKEALQKLGIKITSETEAGFAQFRPSYRNSDNPKGASINLKTGITIDWAAGEKFPIEVLIHKITGKELSKEELKKYHDLIEEYHAPEKEKEIWSEDALLHYLPDYSYWTGRGISEDTLRFFKGGVAHGGKLYNRYVWPCYNRLGQIIGFTGRDLTGKSNTKYKHLGSSGEFLFGLFNKDSAGNKPILQEILKGHVILVEGPSDSVACYDEGLKNVLPTMGLNISPTVISFLLAIGIKKITIAYNRDETFRGQNAAVKMFTKLADHFDLDKLEIKYPEGNDLADNKEKIKNFLDKKPENVLMEFREKYRRHLATKHLESSKQIKFTNKEMKLGKELGK